MTNPIRLITFDLDDTLWDVRPALDAAERAQWSYLQRRFPSLELDMTPPGQLASLRQAILTEHPELIHQISTFREVFIDRLLQYQGIAPAESAAAAQEAFAAFLSERHNVVVYKDAPAVLKTLGQHYPLGALTNGNADVRKTSISDCFDHAWRAEEFGVSKPDPELFRRAFAQAGVTAGEVIHVGDCHDNDVSGAVSAGAAAVWYCPAGGTSDIAASVITDLKALPGTIAQIATRGQAG